MAVNDNNAAETLISLALLAGGLYIAVNWWRSAQADPSGEYFAPAPPSSPSSPIAVLEPLLDFLVPRQLSDSGAAFIKAKEGGFRAWPYPDAGGQSIGYGHFIQPGDNINPPITQSQADALFASDTAAAADAINSNVTVALDQNQFDALVDFVFNEGVGHFLSSTLLQDLNAGDFASAADQLNRWIYSQGSVNSDLQARRADEITLFNS